MFTVRAGRPEELEEIVRLVLAQPELTPRELDRHVEAFLASAGRHRLLPEHQFVVEGRDRLLTGCLRLDFPGRTSLLFPPSMRLHGALRSWVLEMLAALRRGAANDGIRLLQCLLWPANRDDEAVLREAGFEYLTELIYLDRHLVAKARRHSRRVAGFDWTTYGPRTHDAFVETIRATYEDSLDCPRLNGLREMRDVLEGHKATGAFDRSDWFLATRPGEPDVPSGVLLLSRVPRAAHGGAIEVVYMGVVPRARRQGMGSVLLERAIARGYERKVGHLTLAVDAANQPARAMYERFGFFETARRRAWICPL